MTSPSNFSVTDLVQLNNLNDIDFDEKVIKNGFICKDRSEEPTGKFSTYADKYQQSLTRAFINNNNRGLVFKTSFLVDLDTIQNLLFADGYKSFYHSNSDARKLDIVKKDNLTVTLIYSNGEEELSLPFYEITVEEKGR